MNLLLWQLIDSGFPSGGFAHSGGLEASVATRPGARSDTVSLRSRGRRWRRRAGRALPLVTAAHQQPDDLVGARSRCPTSSLKSRGQSREPRAGARACSTSVRDRFRTSRWHALEAQVHQHRLAGHHAPMFGAVFSALAIPLADTQRAFLFTGLRGIASAAVRLGLIGALRSAGSPGARWPATSTR